MRGKILRDVATALEAANTSQEAYQNAVGCAQAMSLIANEALSDTATADRVRAKMTKLAMFFSAIVWIGAVTIGAGWAIATAAAVSGWIAGGGNGLATFAGRRVAMVYAETKILAAMQSSSSSPGSDGSQTSEASQEQVRASSEDAGRRLS